MRTRFFLLLGVLILLVTFMWPEKQLRREVYRHEVQNIQAEEMMPENPPAEDQPTISHQEIKTFRKSLPETQEAQNEIKDNPHQAPRSLIQFAKTLGPLMDKAMENTEDASLLLHELESCVSHSTVLVSARTLCLSRAEQLGKAHSELRPEVSSVRKHSQKDALAIYKKMNSFVKKGASE
ncbi:MAG: hypothetical protein ACJ76H_05840 [Bacteriovoracaceae bacterium]